MFLNILFVLLYALPCLLWIPLEAFAVVEILRLVKVYKEQGLTVKMKASFFERMLCIIKVFLMMFLPIVNLASYICIFNLDTFKDSLARNTLSAFIGKEEKENDL